MDLYPIIIRSIRIIGSCNNSVCRTVNTVRRWHDKPWKVVANYLARCALSLSLNKWTGEEGFCQICLSASVEKVSWIVSAVHAKTHLCGKENRTDVSRWISRVEYMATFILETTVWLRDVGLISQSRNQHSKSVRGRTDRRMPDVDYPCTALADRKWAVDSGGSRRKYKHERSTPSRKCT